MKSSTTPFYRLISFMLLFAFFLMADSLFDAILVVLVIILSFRIYRVNPGRALKPLLRLYGFYLTVFLFNAFFQNGETVYWKWWIFTLSLEGMLTGIEVVVRVFIVSVLANILTLGMSAMELSDAIGMLLSPLRLLHIPVDQASFMIAEAFSFIPGLSHDADDVGKAMRARGAHGNMKLTRMVLPLSISAFRRADDMSMALLSRGYDGSSRRRHISIKPSMMDLLVLIFSILLTLSGAL